MGTETTRWTQRLSIYLLNLLAFVLLFSLPGLWVAWTGGMLVGVLLAGIAAAILYCVLYAFLESSFGTRNDLATSTPPPDWREEFATEASRLGPVVHHNRHPEDPAFRKRMDRLMRRPDPYRKDGEE